MIEFSSKKIKVNENETLLKKHFNLDAGLDCFIIISSNDDKFSDALSHKVLDCLIDRINPDDVYNDFSIFLENINSFIKTWKKDSDIEIKSNVVISLLHKNNFLFSTTGTASCYLINSSKDVLEITDHKLPKKHFDYISEWKITAKDIVVCSNGRLFNYLSKSDFIDSLKVSKLDDFTSNLKQILRWETVTSNTSFIALRNITPVASHSLLEHKYVKLAGEYGMKLLDNSITTKIVGLWLIAKDKIMSGSHILKNAFIVGAILLCLFVLYSIISGLLGSATQTTKKDTAKIQLQTAIEHIKTANKNIANEDIFNLNIENAENIVREIKENELYINDVNKISSDINALKKQYNGIETFNENADNLVYKIAGSSDAVTVINNGGKLFIIHDKSITGPIITGQADKKVVFDKLEPDEKFIDATLLWSDIILLTNFSKVVKFTKNAYFSFQDVKDQVTWDQANALYSFGNNNIYFIGEDKKQIKRHTRNTNGFNAWSEYLKSEDSSTIGEILSIGIDGGIYILKKDMSMIKFFASPKYRLQSLILNKLPKNYGYSDGKIDIKTAANLNYVYMLLDNKIWIFKPDSTRYQDTKSLTYLGQIEWQNYQIKDFYVKNDGEVYIINNDGLYKMKFEENDGKIILR